MKKRIALIAAAVFLLTACGCGGGEASSSPASDTANDSLFVEEGYAKISPDELAGVNIFGTSVEFDPHFLSQNVAKGVSAAEDWAIVERRVEKMGISRFRVMLLPSWLEPFNDNDDPETINWDALTPESAEMQSLYKVLDLAEKCGIDVNLTLWGAENTVELIDIETSAAVKAQGGHFLAKGNQSTNWVMGTLYPEEFAENFSAYVQLLKKKGYTCVKEITPVNEPNWSYQIDTAVAFSAYKELCLAIDERFKKDGIRGDVLFNLSDNTDSSFSWLEQTVSELDSVADIYNSHTYMFGYSTENSTMIDWETENRNITRNTGKPHMVGEFGSNLTLGSSRQTDIDRYERGVLIVREMLNFYNAGAASASYWVLCDEYYRYTDTYNSMMMLGLWRLTKETYVSEQELYESIKEDYEVRPQYYAFSLFSKHVPKGAEVYPISLGDGLAAGTAFKGSDGKWVYVFANGNGDGAPMRLALKNGEVYGSFEKYVYSEDSLPEGDELISPSGVVAVKNQVLSFELAPQTVVLFKQL